MSHTKSITVEILDKTFQLSCPEGEETNLHRAARFLNQKLKDLKENNRTLDKERIAIITALNITHELFKLQNDIGLNSQASSLQVTQLIKQIDDALHDVQT